MTTIAEKLTTIKNALTAIKNSIIAKGQTPTGDITTYATAIDNIESGGGSSSDFVGIPREITSDGVFDFPIENFIFTLPSNVKDISTYALHSAFYECAGLMSVDLSNLSTISGFGALHSAFEYCANLTSVDLSNLSTISGTDALYKTFYECTKLTSVNLSNLSTISGKGALQNAFYECASLTSVDLSNLSTISGSIALQQAFYNCTSLKELSFPALTSNSFGLNTNQFNYMLMGVTGCTVHFPSNLESVIGSWSNVTSGFGGSNTTVLFDLPATA